MGEARFSALCLVVEAGTLVVSMGGRQRPGQCHPSGVVTGSGGPLADKETANGARSVADVGERRCHAPLFSRFDRVSIRPRETKVSPLGEYQREKAYADFRQQEREASEDAYKLARWHTIRTLRAHPELPKWLGTDPPDSAQRPIVERWWDNVNPYLNERWKLREERLDALLDECQGYLDFGQYEDLAAMWTKVRTGPAWVGLTLAARWLYAALHALAQDRSAWGGPRVLLAHRPAMALIEILGGPRYTSLGTMTKAKVELVSNHLIGYTPGQAWEKGKKSRPGRYEILDPTPVPVSELALREPFSELSPSGGRDSSLSDPGTRLPRLIENQRAKLSEAFTRSQSHRVNTEAEADALCPPVFEEYQPDDEPAWWGHLIAGLSPRPNKN